MAAPADFAPIEGVTLESRPCPLGCAETDKRVFVGHDRLQNLPGEFQVVKCQTCGLMRTDPRPTPESMGFYYPETYAPYQTTRVSPVTGQTASTFRQSVRATIRRFVNLQVDSIPPLNPGRMLEIGCASGMYLHRMANEGWQVEGVEFSEQAAAAARALGYHVYTGPMESAPAPDQPYDLVAGWMVFEHLHEPVRVLRKIHSSTNSKAWLTLSLPNAGCFQWSLFRNRWFPLQLPNHLYHYTSGTLTRVLDEGGWEVRKILHQRDAADLVASLGHTLQDYKLFPQLAVKLAAFPETQGKLYLALARFPTC
jgi:2-polyprenyl-3-methyl-5-hydroxy-6-metoxy-1,4-benzoquinol methylase